MHSLYIKINSYVNMYIFVFPFDVQLYKYRQRHCIPTTRTCLPRCHIYYTFESKLPLFLCQFSPTALLIIYKYWTYSFHRDYKCFQVTGLFDGLYSDLKWRSWCLPYSRYFPFLNSVLLLNEFLLINKYQRSQILYMYHNT